MNFREVKDGEESLLIPIPRSYHDCIELARSDYYRYTGKVVSFWRLWLATFRNPCFKFSFWLRLSAYPGILYPFCRLIQYHYARKYGLQISPRTAIGYGLYIGHGFGTIVNPSAVIGNNVNLSQFTTIGSNHGQAAIIGNNVYVGPSVCLVEAVNIGSDVSIGAGAVVTKDIPRGMTAVGVPAHVIGENKHGNYIGHPWKLPATE